MRLFIDCEFNGPGGELLSLALVPDDPTRKPFYVELEIPTEVDQWVLENVIPKLTASIEKVSYQQAQIRLEDYLEDFENILIVADWPQDIAYFCNLMITGPGTRIDTPPIHFYITRIDAQSDCPHHALFDALALRNAVLTRELSGQVF